MSEHKKISKESVYMPHARTDWQRERMEDIANRGICFMCPEHVPEFFDENDGIIEESTHAFFVYNGAQYDFTDIHIMAIPKAHIERLQDIPHEFITEAFDFFGKFEQEQNVTGGAVAMRFGNPAETGGTAHHLHMHFIVPQKNLTPGQSVKFRMSPKKDAS